jgi:hypothetical protein
VLAAPFQITRESTTNVCGTTSVLIYTRNEFELAPGDCLIFDSHTVHGAPNPVPPSETVNRLTMRFAKGDALFEKRGSWTDEQTDYWEAHGMREGKPLVKGSLLPIVWQRKETL